MADPDKRGQFFMIDLKKFEKVCDLGLYPALTYLTISCGVQHDTDFSTWGVKSNETWAGIGRPRAKRAVDTNIRHRHMIPATHDIAGRQKKGLRLPTSKEPAWVYVPNTFIKGAAGELPPIQRLRKLGDIRAVRMIMQIYQLQDLPANGGLDWESVHREYERQLITERGRFGIYGWNPLALTAPFASPLRKQFGSHTEASNQEFYNTLHSLQDIGLIEWVRVLVERPGPDAEIIFPCPDYGSGTELEREVAEAANDAVHAILEVSEGGHKYQLADFQFTAPIPDDLPDVTAIDVLRTRYRAQTSKHYAWGAELHKCENHIADFRELADKAAAGLSLKPNSRKTANV